MAAHRLLIGRLSTTLPRLQMQEMHLCRPWVVDSQRTAVACYSVFITGNSKRQKLKKLDACMDWAKPLLELKEKQEGGTECDAAQGDPHMLHVVQRIKRLKGRPWWEKDVMKKLGLDIVRNRPVLLKNTPSINKLLMEVKHLVLIQPLRLPHGLPEHPSDFEHTLLKSNGELVVKKRLPDTYTAALQSGDIEDKDEAWRMDPETVKKKLDLTKRKFEINMEYNPTEYAYKRNEDGKEYRYTHNLDNPKYQY